MDTCKQHLSCVDLYDVFPGSAARYQSYRPRLRLAPLGFPLDTNIVIHDELVCLASRCVVPCMYYWFLCKYIHIQLSLKGGYS